ncbi:MAG: AtpZ/AtpI family protein [Phycisphaerales bacterium]|nr:AtpZ/AtpI family protein [Phycisphaerales bacterium]
MKPPDSDRSSAGREATRRLWRLSGMGLELASHVVAGLLIGWGIDHFAGTGRLWLIIGTVAGVVTGMASFIRGAMAETHSAEQTARRDGHVRAARPLPPDPDPDAAPEDDADAR